jgi:hypothetical protein
MGDTLRHQSFDDMVVALSWVSRNGLPPEPGRSVAVMAVSLGCLASLAKGRSFPGDCHFRSDGAKKLSN